MSKITQETAWPLTLLQLPLHHHGPPASPSADTGLPTRMIMSWSTVTHTTALSNTGDILNMVSVSQNLTQTENPGHNPEHHGPQEPV